MNITADYHLHSNHSGDSNTDMESMILSGIHHGLTDMCFTEHHDMDFVYGEGEPPIFTLQTDAYLKELQTYQKKYASRIQLLFGVELGVQAHIAPKLSAYVQAYPFDYVIASSHLCHRKDPYLASFYEGRSETSAYLEYFESILENLSVFTDFDIYGHLDYVVRYGPHKNEQYSYLKYADILDAILHRLLDLGKGIELNTGGYRSGLGEPNPCIDVLKRYHELGGELITVGSDAHKPEAVCENFSQAASILHAAGFTYYCTFRSRTPSYHLL